MMPQLSNALARSVAVEQAKGLLRESLDLSVTDAFTLLRRYAHHFHTPMSEVARQLVSEPDTRPTIIAIMTDLASTAPATRQTT